MRVLTGAVAALALVGSTGAQAQVYLAEPAPVYANPAAVVVAPPAPVLVAPAYVAPDYAYVPPPYSGSIVVNAPDYAGQLRSGRLCCLHAQ